MDEDFDTGTDFSDDIGADFSDSSDFGGDFSLDTDISDFPEDIGEDISEDFSVSDGTDITTDFDDVPTSIDEDVFEADSTGLSSEFESGLSDDNGDLSDFDAEIPEDIADESSLGGLGDIDEYDSEIPDEISEDTDSFNGELTDDSTDVMSIPEDTSETDFAVDSESVSDIPEDISASDEEDAIPNDNYDIAVDQNEETPVVDADDVDEEYPQDEVSDQLSETVDFDSSGVSHGADNITDSSLEIAESDTGDSNTDSTTEIGDTFSSVESDEGFDAESSDSKMSDITGDTTSDAITDGVDSGMPTDTTADTTEDTTPLEATDKTPDAVIDGVDSGILTDTTTDTTENTTPLEEADTTSDDVVDGVDSGDATADTTGERTPMDNLSTYMSDHNYGPDDYAEYSQDPEWQRLHGEAFPDWEGRPDVSPEAADTTSDAVVDGMDSGDATADTTGERTPMDNLSTYMSDHNYGPDDYAEYSQDPEWQRLHGEAFPDWEGRPDVSPEAADTTSDAVVDGVDSGDATTDTTGERTPMDNLSTYMSDHNYGPDDYAEYSQDPEWQRLHGEAFPEWEGRPDTPDRIDDAVDSREDVPTQDISNADTADVVNNPAADIIPGDELFERFGTSPAANGSDVFVKGDNFDQFEKDYYSPDASTFTKYDIPQERDVSPSMIEGIHLGKSEAEDPAIFWGQHETGGTAESFQEIASHIPEVRDKLSTGATLEDLAADPELSDCASIYFGNRPEVIEHDGYYEFDSNGRHRILAARALGYDIPVRVIGKRSISS